MHYFFSAAGMLQRIQQLQHTMQKNQHEFQRASRVIPGGVNSPVRAFRQVGGEPFFVAKALGPYLFDVEGKRYIDYIGSWGPAIAGHAHPEVIEAVQKTAADGLSFGAPCPLEATLAEMICATYKSIAMLRFVSSGTEACLSAIRLARGYTKRDRIIKYAGCYHGHADSFLVKAGSGVATLNLPNSPGVPSALAELTHTCDFNSLEQTEAILRAYPNAVAAIIVEPVAGNMNMVLPTPEFLPGLRKLADQYGAVLIFDEVMTGFRVALDGAQGHYQVTPDLSTFGKVIGAGMPVGAYGGRLDIMQQIAPLGPVYQAGTLSGNPVAMAAGIANLNIIQRPGFFAELSEKSRQLCDGMAARARKYGIEFASVHLGGMFGFYFRSLPAQNFTQAGDADIVRFKRFFHACLQRGVYFAPSAYEAGFISSAHDAQVIDTTLDVCDAAFAEIAA
jgi:glutamate-1-semialdehyde 2,1-aminomutase